MAAQPHVIDQLRDQVRNPRNRLEVHGLVFRMNGFPIYADEDGPGELEQVDEVREPKWEWEKDLTGEDKAYFWLMLGTLQQGLIRYGSEEWQKYFTHPKLMGMLIEEYGIKCWHYSLHRRPLHAIEPPFECLVCDSYIITAPPLSKDEVPVIRPLRLLES